VGRGGEEGRYLAESLADEKLGNVKNAQACREQWQRTTGKKIKAALAEKS